MYRLSLDGYKYYYNTLEEACERFLKYLSVFSLEEHALNGKFETTSTVFYPIKKVKKYILEIDSKPPLNLEIFKIQKEPLAPELVYYHLKTKMEKYKCKH